MLKISTDAIYAWKIWWTCFVWYVHKNYTNPASEITQKINLADIHLSNINTATRLSFFQYVPHTPRNDRCKHFCQECDEAVCPSCISSDIHKKHVFLKISEIFHARKEIINNDTKELEEILFPSSTIIVQKEESYATILEKDYQKLKQSVEDQCTKWHDEIDKFVNNLQNETK